MQVPVKTGYQSLGWSKSKKASKADYKAGQNVTISKTLTLYAVYKKFLTQLLSITIMEQVPAKFILLLAPVLVLIHLKFCCKI